MKIALVNTADLGGGAERSVLALHEGLLAAGHESTFYVGRKHTSVPGVVEIPNVRGIPGSRRLARLIEHSTGWQDIYNPSFRSLKKLVASDTDVIHFNNLWGGSGGGFADIGVLPALTRRIPGILTEHQTWFFTGHCAYFRDCERWKTGCGQCPDLTITPAIPKDGTAFNWRRKRSVVSRSNLTFVGISNWVTGLAEQSPIWEGKRKLTIFEGIDTDVFHPVDQTTKQAIRAELGIPQNRVVILVTGQTLAGFVDGFAPQGLNAAQELERNKVILLLVGRPSEAAAKMIDHPSIAIPFRSTPKEMARCFQAADINLSVSRVEAFGCIPAEAQACGIPVVASDSGGLTDVVKTDLGGISVPYHSRTALVQALSRLVEDQALRQELGQKGRDYVVNNFGLSRIVSNYLDLYRRLAQTGPA